MNLPDIQNQPDSRDIALQSVGIREVTLPITFVDGKNKCSVTAEFALSVSLDAKKKGVNMSRFMELLAELVRKPFGFKDISTFLDKTSQKLEASQAEISITFEYFILKQAPITEISAPMGYRTTLQAQKSLKENIELHCEVEITASNCCPCSKEISNHGAHNQRLRIVTDVELDPLQLKNFSLKDIIADLESNAASCPVFPILKRPDEKFVTERQYENPKFVEDVVRDGVVQLRTYKDKGILSFILQAEALESIHRHNAWACYEETL